MDLNVHHVLQSVCYSSYFIQRDHGNILVFADALASIDRDFLKSRGGLYRQFIENQSLISLEQCELFKVFGAAGVGLFEEGAFNAKIKLEKFGIDFIDQSIKLNTFSSLIKGTVLGLKQRGQKLAFLGRSFYLSGEGEVFCNDQPLGEKFFEIYEANQTSWLFFAHHAKGRHYLRL